MSGDPRGRWPALLTLSALYLVLVVPAVLSGRGGTSEASDEHLYHLPVIETMIEQWPAVDLVDYRSSTAPGYHLAMAAIAQASGERTTVLRLVNAGLGLAMVLVAFTVVRRRQDPWPSLVLVLPLLFSTYVLSGAIWLTTDNAAQLWVLLAVGGAATVPATVGRSLRWGVYGTLAVAVRQIHVWPTAVIAMAGWLAALRDQAPRKNVPLLVGATLGAALPFVLLGVFVAMWGGLTPPTYRSIHDAGLNLATPAFALALVGGFGVLLLPMVGVARDRLPALAPWLFGAAGLGLVGASFPPTAYDMEAGRWGGALWSVVEATPAVADRSIVLAVLAALGAVVLVLLYDAASRRGHVRSALLLLLALAGFVAAQTVNSQCWQRYLEATVLTIVIWLASQGAAARPGWRLLIGVAILAAGQGTISLLNVYLPMLRDAGGAG